MLRRLLAVLVSLAVLLILSPVVTDRAQAVVETGVAATGETRLPAAVANQGLTLVGNGEPLLTRGHHSIPAQLRALGWVHIGDPDSARGLVLDAYQGSAGATSKAFAVTYPDGARVLLVHPLAPGEQYNNSFVAISPNTRWFVAAEWGTVNRLLVFALPTKPPPTPMQTLPLAGVIHLRHPVRNVQGCDFSSPTRLLCSTNDTSTSLFPVTRQLLALHLKHPVHGGRATASVRLVGSAPAQDVCAGASGEVEGIDVTDGVVRVAVNSPCAPVTEVFSYPRTAQWRPADDIDVRPVWTGAPPFVDVVVGRPWR
ncbi:hypothetical protein [uncultured Jatrophihabitans sp.]|uniref:hypothetical protein n=1 Tax=uncultured Jatrophihabitans sp. TaxID=1610747 RepID=UPI0035C9E580